MNRRNFFKNLGVAAVGAIVAPAIVVKATEKIKTYKSPIMKEMDGGRFFSGQYHEIYVYSPPFTKEVIEKLYKRYGNMSSLELARIDWGETII